MTAMRAGSENGREKECNNGGMGFVVAGTFLGLFGFGSPVAVEPSSGDALDDNLPISSTDSRLQTRRKRKALFSWVHSWVGFTNRRDSGAGELNNFKAKQHGSVSAAQEQQPLTKRSSVRSRSKSGGSLGSMAGSRHSKSSSLCKSNSIDYYGGSRNQRRSALDLTAGTRCGTPMEGIRSSANILCSYSFFVTAHRGSHAKIIKARNRHTSQRVVLKVYDKDRISANLLENITKEMRILNIAKGVDGIVQLEDSYEDSHQAVSVLEDCTGGTLISKMASGGGQLNEASCVHHVVKPLLQVLAWLHSNGIVFRDLKPEHIMFDGKGHLRLVDFFSAAVYGEDSLVSREGTLAYMAPEMVIKPSPDEIFNEVIGNGLSEADLPSYNEKVDIWSLGVTIFEVLTSRQPFLAETPEELRCIHARTLGSSGGIRTSLDCVKMREFMSNDALDFLGSMLRVNPDERPSAVELLEHPWLKVDSKIVRKSFNTVHSTACTTSCALVSRSVDPGRSLMC